MHLEAAKLLLDIREAIQEAELFTEGMSLADYQADARTRAAVERKFEIIGEACSRLLDRCPEVFQSIASGPQIISLRHRIIHGYDQVDSVILWDILKNKLPVLRAELPQG